MIKELLKKNRPLVFTIRLIRNLRDTYLNRRCFRKLAARYREFDALVLKDRQAGFFSIYFQALCAYRIAQVNHQKVLFEFDTGPYYSESRVESSWWDYYFEKRADSCFLQGEIPGNHCLIQSIPEQHEFSSVGGGFDREIGSKLVQEFPTNELTRRKIESFVDLHFRDAFVIGLHYRGTDKVTGQTQESVRLDYEFIESVLDEIVKLDVPFRLFLATDEEDLVQFLMQKTNLDICFTNSARSKSDDSLHLGPSSTSRYQLGLEAVVDAVLLSKSDFLLRTDSNLSRASEFFDPNLETLNISSAFKRAGQRHQAMEVTMIARRVAAGYHRKAH